MGGTDEGERGSDEKKRGENAELTSTAEKQNLEAEANSMKRFNESESASSDLAPEEQLEKPRKLDKMQKDKIAEYKREENVFCDTRRRGFVEFPTRPLPI